MADRDCNAKRDCSLIHLLYTSLMIRPGHLLPKNFHLSFALPQPVAIDLGSSYTRVKLGNKLVFHDRTCIVYHEDSQEVVAIGQAAEVFQGRVPAGMKLVRPIRQGKISHVLATQLFLKSILEQVNQPAGFFPIPFIFQQVTIAANSTSSSVQKDLLLHFFRNCRAQARFTSKSAALFSSILTPPMLGGVWCCLDIGGMTTEVAIWANGQVISQQTLEIGGDHFTKQVLSVTKKKYQAEIGWLTAEQIKKNVFCLSGEEGDLADVASQSDANQLNKSRRVKKELPKNVAGKFTVRARSSATDLPTTIMVTADSYLEAVQEVAQELVWLIREAMQDLSPELLSACLENGVILTGGGALLPGLAKYLEQQLQSTVVISSHPHEDLIRGLV